MDRFSIIRLVLPWLLVLGIAWLSHPTQLLAEVTAKHREVVQSVFDRLIAAQDRPEGWEVWPPVIRVSDDEVINAFATHEKSEDGLVPIVVINRGLIEKVAKFDTDVLAFTIGHEIGHLVHFHSQKYLERREKYGSYGASTAMIAVDREAELEADLFGMKLALAAGFSHAGIRKNLLAMMGPETGSYYCSFEGLKTDHPAWDVRASLLQEDEVQEQLWRSMVAFRNGVLFLETENYLHAEFCFRRVVDEFPDSCESWANLGYSLLMQYCDALDEEDLKSFDIGHLVVGGFYRRPDSLSSHIRGIDEDLWFEAVGALRESLRLRERLQLADDMLLVKANLAVAYLIHPAGKQIGEAEKYFAEVFAGLAKPQNADVLDPITKAALFINAGAGRGWDADLLESTLAELKSAAAEREGKQAVAMMKAAIDYSQARSLANSSKPDDRRSSLEKFESYLSSMSQASSWWPLAYEQYARIAKELGETPKQANDFRIPSVREWRPVSSVALPDGSLIGLSQPFEATLRELGPADSTVSIIPGTNLKRSHYEQYGISVLGSREVLAIFLCSETSPPIHLTRPGIGGDSQPLQIGMPRSELEKLLGDEWDVQFASIDDPETVYQLYRDVGIAAKFTDGKVSELVVVVVPRGG